MGSIRSPPPIEFIPIKFDHMEEDKMKFIPRKVYIKETDDYIEMEYDEFLKAYPEYTENTIRRLRNDPASDSNNSDEKFFIPIQGCLLEVDEENYREYYKENERYKYIRSLDYKNRLLSASAIASSLNQEDFADVEAGPEYDVESNAIAEMLVKNLRAVMYFLSGDELTMIDLVYYKCLSYADAAAVMGISKSTFENRLSDLHEKIKVLMEI